MADKLWKTRERMVAKFFGTERNPLSGRNSKHSASDTLHPELFIEHKHRQRHSVLNAYHEAKRLAKDEDKIPLVTLSEKGKRGFWVVCPSSDLTAIANQRLNARKDEI